MENLLEELRWIFIEPFTTGDGLGIVLAILTAICVLVLIALIVWGLFYAIDSWFLITIKGHGKVIGKNYIESHTSYVPISNGKTTTLTPVHHPDAWTITIAVNGNADDINVSEGDYVKIKPNTTVPVEYVNGRLSGDLYLKDIFVR